MIAAIAGSVAALGDSGLTMTRRIWAPALVAAVALITTATGARAEIPTDSSHCLMICPPSAGPFDKPNPAPTPTVTPSAPAPTPAASNQDANLISYDVPTPYSGPPTPPDSGSAASQVVTATPALGGLPQAAGTGTLALADQISSAPGFASIGIPMILFFAIAGLTSFSIRKRL